MTSVAVKPLDVRPVPTTTDLSILLDQITSLRKRLAEESPDVIPRKTGEGPAEDTSNVSLDTVESTSSGGSGTADALLPLVSFGKRTLEPYSQFHLNVYICSLCLHAKRQHTCLQADGS